jgi:heptosyltransferase I
VSGADTSVVVAPVTPADPVLVDALGGSRHLCIVLLTGLGDVVHGLPIACALRRRRPDLRITWIAEPMPAGILGGHAAIDRVVMFHRKRGWRGVRALRAALRADPADLTVDLNVYFKAVFPTLLSGAPQRVGFGRDRARDATWLFHNRHLPARPRRHTMDMFLEFLDVLGVPADPLEWRLDLTDEEREEQRRFFGALDGRPVALIAATSANAKKDWVTKRWAVLADALDRDHGMRVVLIGGPGERETRVARAIIARAEHPPVFALGDGVRRLIWLIEGARLLVAPDTGPVHIARALGVPVIGLYGHTNPWRVGPWRSFADLWVDAYNPPDSAPDASAADPRHGRMETITVERVLERVRHAAVRYGVTDPV